MAFQSQSPISSHGRTTAGSPAADESATGLRRVLRALTAAHRARIRFDLARFRPGRPSASPEPEHALSWRFGVPVR
ncbi:hypothetical protein [Methylobacterium sp. Leaf118]|uniref:hypothetical protein n=1 Tax=Methylobacterium sp. Leaf118 TaxID=2876562 RepID=UPI001E540755|nr:hypothetical protein [Methylobacterium sp. Leaf118]